MKLSRYRLRAAGWRSVATPAFGLLFLATLGVMALATGAEAAATPVLLGATSSFAVLAGTTITNTGPTTINGDIGTSPGTSITGAASMTLQGTTHSADAVALTAQTDLVTAYNVAASETPASAMPADLVGLTLAPGVYSAGEIGLTGALTLNAGGDPNAVFVFKAGSTLITGSGSVVNLINGAQSCNVFWQVGSSATLGTGSTFRGTILALTSISVTTGVTIDGRVLARNGAVTLDTDTITRPACAASAPTTTTTSTSTTTPTASSSPTGPATPTAGSTPAAFPPATTPPIVLPRGVNAGTGGQAAGTSSVATPIMVGLGLAGLLGVVSTGGVVALRRRR